jgi:hypothetical protein
MFSKKSNQLTNSLQKDADVKLKKIMNKLDLNAYGVSEMTKQEMKETDGGILGLIAIGFFAVGTALDLIFKWDNVTNPVDFVIDMYNHYF